MQRFSEEFRKTGWITINVLKRLRQECEKNGFKSCFFKIGKRVLIDVNEFWKIVEKKKGEK